MVPRSVNDVEGACRIGSGAPSNPLRKPLKIGARDVAVVIFSPAARQGAVRYNPQLIRLNGAQRANRRQPRGCGGPLETTTTAATANANHYRQNRSASTVSPDERGSNSPCHKITLSQPWYSSRGPLGGGKRVDEAKTREVSLFSAPNSAYLR